MVPNLNGGALTLGPRTPSSANACEARAGFRKLEPRLLFALRAQCGARAPDTGTADALVRKRVRSTRRPREKRAQVVVRATRSMRARAPALPVFRHTILSFMNISPGGVNSNRRTSETHAPAALSSTGVRRLDLITRCSR